MLRPRSFAVRGAVVGLLLAGCPSGGQRVLAPDAGVGDADVRDADTTPWFEDVAEVAGVDLFVDPSQRLVPGMESLGGGVCVLDSDGEGAPDLFFTVAPSIGTARLYEANAAFEYEDRTELRGLSGISAVACLAFDAEGDGDDDLLVLGRGYARLYEHQDGGFTLRQDAFTADFAPEAGYQTAAAGDFDSDGDLDLVVGTWGLADRAFPCAKDAAVTAAISFPSMILLQESPLAFVDRTAALTDAFDPPPLFLVALAADINDDGRTDIYVGNDCGALYRNQVLLRDDEGFLDVGDDYGLVYTATGRGLDSMGITHGDIDRNGRVDFVVSNFQSFPTSVFMCPDSEPYCEDRGAALGTSTRLDMLRWGVGLGDFDSDGYIDLIEANGGWLRASDYDEATVPIPPDYGPEQALPSLYRNMGGASFVAAPLVRRGAERMGRGLALVDLDSDGRLDAVMASALGRPLVLHNVRNPDGHWLRVILRGNAPNTRAVGAKAVLLGPRGPITRLQLAGEGYSGNFDSRLHFGIESEATAVALSVRWPSGVTTQVDIDELDREIVLVEPAPE